MGTRHERVVVDLDDKFSRNAAGMAAATSMFRRNLDDADHSLISFDRHTQDVGRNIDKLSGRLGLFIDLAATLGPALIPTTAALVPLLAGLSNQLGFAAIAGGSTILAFQGVGDALKAVNEQALHPSVANLEKMHEAMATLGPAGRDFVRELQAMRPEMQKLQDAAQAGLFPGMTEGIESLMTRMPQAERIIGDVSATVGDLLARAGDSLASDDWDQFFQTLESEARPTLEALGESIGQVTKGLAELWIAFTPLNRDFSQGMLDASKSFAEWADGLSATAGFQDFMNYLSQTGPLVADALGSIANALLQVLKAAAPLGAVALKAITAFADAISAIADSDLGTPILAAIAAMRAYSIAASLAAKAQLRFNTAQAGGFGATAVGTKAASTKSWASGVSKDLGILTTSWATAGAKSERESARMRASAERLRGSLAGVGKGAAGIAALGVASSGAADKIGLTNTASLALMGTFIAPGWGTAIGAAAGAAIDLTHANDGLNDSLAALSAMAGKVDMSTFNAQLAETKKQVDDLSNVDGFWDLLGDTAKTFGGTLKGDGGFLEQRGKARNELQSAEMKQQTSGRNAGSAAATKQYAAAQLAASQLAAQGFKLTAAGARDAAMSVDQFTFSMRGAAAALGRMSNWDSFRGAVLDAKDAVAEAGKTLQKNGDIIRGQGRDMQRAGLESRGLLRNIAQQAVTTSEGMKDIGRRTKFLDNARGQFIGVARAMGLSGPAARRMADGFGLVDRSTKNSANSVKSLQARINALKGKIVDAKAKGAKESDSDVQALRAQIARLKGKIVKINADTGGARAAIGSIQTYINSLHGKTVTIHVNKAAGTFTTGAGDTGSADGGTIQGERYPYGDKVYSFLAPGEEVISNRYGQADRHRELLKAINSNAYANGGTVQRLADGGTASRRGGGNDGDHVNKFTKALRAATKALEKEKAVREGLISKRSELSGTVRDSFLSDPFSSTNVWAKGAGDPRSILRADIAKANQFKSTLGALKKNGLDGSALAAIASTGDVGKARALLGLGRTGINQYESLYQQRAVAATSVGNYAGATVYNPQITATNKELRALRVEINHLRHEAKGHAKNTGREVAKGVNKGAAAAGRNRR